MDENDALAAFSDNDVQLCLEFELSKALERFRSAEKPRAILLAGQPGAGKTELSVMFRSKLQKNAAFVNADDYRRYHPNYHELYAKYGTDSVQMTAKFSSIVSNRLIETLSDWHFHLVIEGTGRTVHVPKSSAEKLTKKGYQTELAVIAARPEISLISTLLRFYQMNAGGTVPRATAISAHDHVVIVLPDNLDILLSVPEIQRITIWDRELFMLYDSGHNLRYPSEVLLEYWNSAWSDTEIAYAEEKVQHLYCLEQQTGLGQMEAVKEIDLRLHNSIQRQNQAFGMQEMKI